MANPLRAPTIYPSVAAMSAAPGPFLESFATPQDRADSIYRWVRDDVTTIDGVETIGHTGGYAGRWRLLGEWDRGSDLTDANQTIHVTGDHWRVMPVGTLTTNRTLTLGTTGAIRGSEITITRLDSSSNTVSIVNGGLAGGTLTTLPGDFVSYAKFKYDGTNWFLREFAPVVQGEEDPDTTVTVGLGSNRGAAINTAAATANALYVSTGIQQTIRLVQGEYRLETAIVLPSGVRLQGAGSGNTIISTSMAPAVGLADDATNALIKVQGATNGAISTTLSAVAPNGHTKITLTSAAGVTAGMKLRIQGNNTPGYPNDMATMSDGTSVILTEIVEVESVLGSVVTIKRPLSQHHKSGLGVVSIDTRDDVTIEGVDLRCDGGTMAVGILFDYARNFLVRDVSGAGFSRALIDCRLGSSDFRIFDVHSRGENNSIVLHSSVMRFTERGITSSASGLRVHANGVPRGALNYRFRCTSGSAEFDIHRCAVGLRAWGGVDLHFRGHVHDPNCADVGARDPELGGATATLGAGVEGGPADLTIAEFGSGCTFDVSVQSPLQPSETDQCAWYHHDHFFCTVDARIHNFGPGPTQVIDSITYHRNGMIVSDVFNGRVSLVATGLSYTIKHRGTPASDFNDVFISGTAGTSSPAAIGLYFENGAVARGSWPRYRRIRIQDIGAFVRFSAAADAAPDLDLRFDEYEQSDKRYYNCIIADNDGSSVNVNTTVELISGTAGTRKVAATTAASRKAGIVCVGGPTDVGTGHIMVCMGDGWVTATTGAVAVGDLIKTSTTTGKVETTATADEFALWIAETDKAGGSEGLIRVRRRL